MRPAVVFSSRPTISSNRGTRNTFQGAAFANCVMAIVRRNPPRSVPRGIAIVPRREVGLAVINRAEVT